MIKMKRLAENLRAEMTDVQKASLLAACMNGYSGLPAVLARTESAFPLSVRNALLCLVVCNDLPTLCDFLLADSGNGCFVAPMEKL